MSFCGILSENSTCRVFRCASCRDIHVEFGTLSIRMSMGGLRRLASCLACIDCEAQECQHRNTLHRRPVMLEIEGTGMHIMMTRDERSDFLYAVREAISKYDFITSFPTESLN